MKIEDLTKNLDEETPLVGRSPKHTSRARISKQESVSFGLQVAGFMAILILATIAAISYITNNADSATKTELMTLSRPKERFGSSQGVSYTEAISGFSESPHVSTYSYEGNVYGLVTGGGLIFYLSDGNWTEANKTLDHTVYAIAAGVGPDGSSAGVIVTSSTSNPVIFSTDGDNWFASTTFIHDGLRYLESHHMAIAYDGHSNYYYMVGGPAMHRSVDYGATWDRIVYSNEEYFHYIYLDSTINIQTNSKTGSVVWTLTGGKDSTYHSAVFASSDHCDNIEKVYSGVTTGSATFIYSLGVSDNYWQFYLGEDVASWYYADESDSLVFMPGSVIELDDYCDPTNVWSSNYGYVCKVIDDYEEMAYTVTSGVVTSSDWLKGELVFATYNSTVNTPLLPQWEMYYATSSALYDLYFSPAPTASPSEMPTPSPTLG